MHMDFQRRYERQHLTDKNMNMIIINMYMSTTSTSGTLNASEKPTRPHSLNTASVAVAYDKVQRKKTGRREQKKH